MRTPNILLAMPSGVKTHFPYLGLAYIQAYMKQRFGKDIRIKTVDLSKKSFSKIRDVLSSAKPDLLGISCMTFTRKESFRIAEIAKEINSNVITVFGGHHCQYLWKQVLTHYPQVDYIVHGEGELILGDLVETLFFGNALNINKVNGISYRQDDIPITTAPAQPIVVLDSLPFPDYGDFDMVQYAEDDWQNKDSRSTIALPVLSSRGFRIYAISAATANRGGNGENAQSGMLLRKSHVIKTGLKVSSFTSPMILSLSISNVFMNFAGQ